MGHQQHTFPQIDENLPELLYDALQKTKRNFEVPEPKAI
jgi:hypothetical protein